MPHPDENTKASSTRKALKFDSGPTTTLAIAEATDRLAATTRYQDEKGIEEGDEIDVLAAESGEKFGVATVEHAEVLPTREVLDVVSLWWAEYEPETLDQLLSELNTYYDDEITATTEVKVGILNPDLEGEWRRSR